MKDNMKRAPFSTQIDLSKFDMKDFAKASDEEKRQQEVMGESTTFFKDGLKRLRKNPLAMGSIIVLVLLILVILLAPKIVPYGYADIVKGAQNLGPFQYSDAEQAQIDAGEKLFPHIFGTDELGRDYFIRVVYGARVSLGVGVFASLLVLIIGIIYGSVSGFCGGKVDMVMMRIVDIIYSLPDMLLIILLAVVLNEVLTPVIKGTVLSKLGVNMIALFIVFGLLYWVGMARLIRGVIGMVEKEVRDNYATNITLKSLSEKYYVNSAYLGQLFRKKYGQSFKDYLNNYRMERAAELLLRTDKKIIQIAEEVGYHDMDYFVNRFIQVKGCTPARFRRQMQSGE